MNRNVLKIKRVNSKTNMVLSMLFPTFLIMIVFVIISYYSFHQNKELKQEYCLSSMQLFSKRCENEIANIVQASNLLSENVNFENALNDIDSVLDSEDLFSVKNTIRNFEETHSVVHDVVIMDRDKERIVSSGGVYTFDEYFENVVTYKNYNKEYWKNYRPFVSSRNAILLPTGFSGSDGSGALLPIVVFENNNQRFKNLFIINISIDALITLQDDYISEDNIKVFLVNNYSGDVFYRSGIEIVTENILDTELYESILNKKFFRHKLKEYGDCLIVAHSTRENLNGYTYFGAIPYASIGAISFEGILMCILLFLIMIVLNIFYSINNTNKLLAPIQRVLGMISNQDTPSQNIFENLEGAVFNLRKTNAELFATVPYAQEKYLINFLNSAEYSITEESKKIIKNTLPFKYEYFASVILRTYPTKLFFDTYNQMEYFNVQSGMHALIKQMFSEKYLTFFMTNEKDALHIILNTENDTCMADIKNIIDEICRLLESDNGYINVYTGVGGIYKDWEGLRNAYLEALSNLKFVRFNQPQIAVRQDEGLNDAEISKLYNALMISNVSVAKDLIEQYSLKSNNDQRLLKQIYTQILATIFKTMRTRNISYNDNQLDFEVYSNILAKPCIEIYKEIILLINVIEGAKENTNSTNLGEEIIAYINNNFAVENLSLDMLAECFKVQPTYISTLVKNTLGVGFHKHLTNLRISKAKELLVHTDLSIQEVYEDCGFYSKPTFFRVFKQATGLTPSEYRKSQNAKDKK